MCVGDCRAIASRAMCQVNLNLRSDHGQHFWMDVHIALKGGG